MPDPGGISTAMYPSTAAAPADPMQTMYRFAATQNMLNQNAMFQQEYRARAALGPILQKSIDPNTGDLDIGKFLVHGAADPNVAWKMPEITLQMIQRKYIQAETVGKELDNAQKRYGAIGDVMGGLWGKAVDDAGGDPTRAKVNHGDMISAIAPLIGTHRISSAEVVTYLNGLAGLPKVRNPTSGQMEPDPRALAQHARQWADTARGVNNALSSTEQAIAPYTAGGTTVLARPSPRTGQVGQVGGIQHALSPAELNSMVERVKPDGSKERVPMWQMLGMEPPESSTRLAPAATTPRPGQLQGNPDNYALGAAGQPAGAPLGGQPGQAPAGPQTGAPQTPAGPGRQTQFPAPAELNPADAKLLEQYPKYREEVNTEATHALRMNQVIDSLEAAQRKIKTGGGAEFYVRAASLLQGLGVSDPAVDKIANGSLPSSQQFQKLQLQLGTALLRAALLPGAGRITNAEFSSFQRQNPNLDTDPRAIKEMFSFLRSMNHIAYAKQQTLDRVTEARGQLWTAQHFDPWWQQRVVKSGAISLGGSRELNLESMHPGHSPGASGTPISGER